MKLAWYRAAVFVLMAFAGLAAYFSVHAATYNQRNAFDQYRWPWTYGQTWTITQGQFNSGTAATDTHTVPKLLQHAVDFASSVNSPVWAARDGTAHCEDWRLAGYSFGFVIRVVHGSDSDFYAHADACAIPMGTTVQVAQGRHISYTGTTGLLQYDFGDHVHFMKASTTTSTYSAAMTMEGVSSFPHPSVVGQTATSDNLAAGYSVGLAWEPEIHDRYFGAGGWSVVGSSASISGWSPGRSTAGGGCPGAVTPGWYQCNVTGLGGIARNGRVQTFKGAGSGAGEHAIFKRAAGLSAATFMSRGFLGGFTDPWDASQRDGLFYMGYPTSDSFYWSGTLYRMNFENGYATFNTNGSNESKFYYVSGGSYVLGLTAYYPD